MPPGMWDQLAGHLFPGDGDEHGAAIGAAVVHTSRGVRLLARKLYLARDGVDYVPGTYGYRMLTPTFVTDCVLDCAERGLAYLAIHCHGGTDSVGFSGPDLASHERGYPALLDILGGPPASGLVFARNAVAGDIWLPDRTRLDLAHLEITGRPIRRLFPAPPSPPQGAGDRYDRQARLFGDRGQVILAANKVGVIGAGGAGSLIVEYLARLGVGELVIIDPDDLEPSNLPRVVGSRERDTYPHRRGPWWQSWAHLPFARHRTPKVRIAERVARAANPRVRVDAVRGDVTDARVADKLIDCDYLFLAADSMQARLVFNAIVHQYLIPGVQVGAKVQVSATSGAVTDIFSVIRPVVPGEDCLWCNELISAARLQEEATTSDQLAKQRYVDEAEIHAPSVITLNAVAASLAANDYLMTITGLLEPAPLGWTRHDPRTNQLISETPRHDEGCTECSPAGRLGAGPATSLPTRG